mgnify:CR=1 FL=1
MVWMRALVPMIAGMEYIAAAMIRTRSAADRIAGPITGSEIRRAVRAGPALLMRDASSSEASMLRNAGETTT